MKKTIWIDIINVPHIHFFKPIINELENKYKLVFTLRDFAETVDLFNMSINKPYKLIGGYAGKNLISKTISSITRLYHLNYNIEYFDLRLGIGGDFACYLSKARGKKSIIFGDNELSPSYIYSRIIDYSFWPSVISRKDLNKKGFRNNKIIYYNGYKEDIYLADYVPDKSFLDLIPFRNYIVLRPENIYANYVDRKMTITPQLIEELLRSNYNILYLPRYSIDNEYISNIVNKKNIFIPEKAINGLDAVYYSNGVITGAGTLAREAAIIGIPSISFYPGSKKLSVDVELNRTGRLHFSRKPSEIIDLLKKNNNFKRHQFYRSKTVKLEFINKLNEILDKLNF